MKVVKLELGFEDDESAACVKEMLDRGEFLSDIVALDEAEFIECTVEDV